MKKLILSIVAIATMSLSSFGQKTPEGFKYQAVVRNASNTILTNQAVGLRMTIQQDAIGGTTVYSETFATTTSTNGLVNVEIGNGTPIKGTFANINWANGPYYIETAVDITGGTAYTVMGTSQLMSVPYALYAKTSGNGQGPAGPQGIQGLPGTNGATGSQGPAGNDGATGLAGSTGAAGSNGTNGNNGQSAYQLAVTNGYIGTEAQWLTSLQGAVGTVGSAGNNGNNGQSAYQLAVTNGYVGTEAQWLTSLKGATGSTGAAGSQGIPGTNGTAGATGPQGAVGPIGGYPVHYIGESYGGGIVFYVYDGGQHGLIAATADQSTGIRWYGGSNTNTCAKGDGVGAGLKNTAIIIANQGPVDGNTFAARLCNEYSVTVGGTKYGDWYLPSKYELNLLYLQKAVVGGGGFALNYWSSTDIGVFEAWMQSFANGDQGFGTKTYFLYVRAVRSF